MVIWSTWRVKNYNLGCPRLSWKARSRTHIPHGKNEFSALPHRFATMGTKKVQIHTSFYTTGRISVREDTWCIYNAWVNSGPWNNQRATRLLLCGICNDIWLSLGDTSWAGRLGCGTRVLYTRRKGGKARESGKQRTGHRSRNCQNSAPSLDKKLSNAQKTPVVEICVFHLVYWCTSSLLAVLFTWMLDLTMLIWSGGYHYALVPHLGKNIPYTGRSLLWSAYAKLG